MKRMEVFNSGDAVSGDMTFKDGEDTKTQLLNIASSNLDNAAEEGMSVIMRRQSTQNKLMLRRQSTQNKLNKLRRDSMSPATSRRTRNQRGAHGLVKGRSPTVSSRPRRQPAGPEILAHLTYSQPILHIISLSYIFLAYLAYSLPILHTLSLS